VLVHDPIADRKEAVSEYGIHLVGWEQMTNLDGLIVAVAHKSFAAMSLADLLKPLRSLRDGVVIDVKSILDPGKVPGSLKYWRL
jgi:UDP-N-acetyl-D-galactosamine dehydrogenase